MTMESVGQVNPWETSERITRLLSAIHSEVTPGARQHVDELVRCLVTLYGAGLSRAIDVARAAGAPAVPLQEGLLADDLVASLLLLHGLHPESPEERIRRRLRKLDPLLGPQKLTVLLQRIDENGVAQLRVDGAQDGRARTVDALRAAMIQAVEEAAPEITEVSIEGFPDSESGLVQLRTHVRVEERGVIGATA